MEPYNGKLETEAQEGEDWEQSFVRESVVFMPEPDGQAWNEVGHQNNFEIDPSKGTNLHSECGGQRPESRNKRDTIRQIYQRGLITYESNALGSPAAHNA